jgi:non-specific protein-tyrosine kinase
VASPTAGLPAPTASAWLAASYALAGKQTILVDADLRRPVLHTLFGAANEAGLSALLSEPGERRDARGRAAPSMRGDTEPSTVRLDESLLPTDVAGLRLLPGGALPAANPAELLASPAAARVLRALQHAAEVVIVSGPPVTPTADAAVLASRGMDVLLVVEQAKTRGEHARAAFEALRRVNAHVVGTVFFRGPWSLLGPAAPFQRRAAPMQQQVLAMLARGNAGASSQREL